MIVGGDKMKRFEEIYVEISNICNLKCSFCPGTIRNPKRMNREEFKIVLNKIKPYTDFICFHLLGEPLCHPDFEAFLKIAEEMKFMVKIVTNGTLISKNKDALLNSKSHYITYISLHSFEANNNNISFEKYLNDCFEYAKSAKNKKIVVLRLWNNGGKDSLNNEILAKLENYFPKPWAEEGNGIKIANKIYVEYGDKFDWPTLESDDINEKIFCPGLRTAIGILADGTVVPCCLDNDGTINLGNIFEADLEEIINSERAQNIYNGFSNRNACEELCKRCSFVRKF
jgi:radical SAM protein with 4Fe4S-binding SPASM domain